MDQSPSQSTSNISNTKPIKPNTQRSSLHLTKDKNKEIAEEASGAQDVAVAKAKGVSCSTVLQIETKNAFEALSLLPDDDMCQGN